MMIIIIRKKRVLEKHGKAYLVKNQIEKNILKRYKVFISRHHVGDLEGNSIRNLMKNGDEIFDETRSFLCEQND